MFGVVMDFELKIKDDQVKAVKMDAADDVVLHEIERVFNIPRYGVSARLSFDNNYCRFALNVRHGSSNTQSVIKVTREVLMPIVAPVLCRKQDLIGDIDLAVLKDLNLHMSIATGLRLLAETTDLLSDTSAAERFADALDIDRAKYLWCKCE
jgi:hypothetical protein